MKKVAKLLIIDPEDKYLIFYRDNHPIFGADPDIPGGTMEDNETAIETMLREVLEESGVVINGSDAESMYSGADYSSRGTHYELFVAKLKVRPEITLSWEHTNYEWLGREVFIKKIENAKDKYMNMVHDVLSKN